MKLCQGLESFGNGGIFSHRFEQGKEKEQKGASLGCQGHSKAENVQWRQNFSF
jgi:hypothetical protein